MGFSHAALVERNYEPEWLAELEELSGSEFLHTADSADISACVFLTVSRDIVEF